jgi:hypothetical protein
MATRVVAVRAPTVAPTPTVMQFGFRQNAKDKGGKKAGKKVVKKTVRPPQPHTAYASPLAHPWLTAYGARRRLRRL